MSLTNKALLLAAALAYLPAAYAENRDSPYLQGHSINSRHGVGSAYNAPARYDVTGDCDFTISGKYIFWQARQGGNDIAIPYNCTTGDGVLYLKGKYKPGFKVALGVDACHDDWKLDAEYTWFCMHKSRSVTSTPLTGSWSPSWLYNDTGFFTTAYGKWSLKMHVGDLMLSRPAYIGTALTFNTQVGGRFFLINQKYRASYLYSNTYDSISKSTSWAVGPRAVLNTNWIFGEGFSSYANLGGTLAYQQLKGSFESSHSNRETIDSYNKNKVGYITPVFEMGVGLAWGSYFDDNGCHFNIFAGYDFNYFWNQNIMRHIRDQQLGSAQDGSFGNLMLHGLTCGFNFEF